MIKALLVSLALIVAPAIAQQETGQPCTLLWDMPPPAEHDIISEYEIHITGTVQNRLRVAWDDSWRETDPNVDCKEFGAIWSGNYRVRVKAHAKATNEDSGWSDWHEFFLDRDSAPIVIRLEAPKNLRVEVEA
jgi:hypothetical protein